MMQGAGLCWTEPDCAGLCWTVPLTTLKFVLVFLSVGRLKKICRLADSVSIELVKVKVTALQWFQQLPL